MKTEFKVGDKVKCISLLEGKEWLRKDNIVVGDILIIQKIINITNIPLLEFRGKLYIQNSLNFKVIK